MGDNLPSEQRTTGFAAQVFFIGIGALVASILPYVLSNYLGVSNTAPEGIIPDSVKWSFYLGGIVYLVAILWTVIFSTEYSPEELASFEEEQSDDSFTPEESTLTPAENGQKQLKIGGITAIIGLIMVVVFFQQDLEKQLHVFSIGILLFGILLMISGLLQKAGKINNAFVTILNDFQTMPKTMKQLAVVQFFSWFALFSMWIYTTAAVTSHIFGSSDTSSQAYNDGADWVGICFAVYNGLAAPIAFLLPVMAKNWSRKSTHIVCLILGAIGLISIFFIRDQNMLLISMIGIAMAWSSILSMPYAMLTGCLPADKMGYYMGVFNFFIVIPQIVAAGILGFFIGKMFNGEAIYAMLIGGISFVIAAIFTFYVDDRDDVVAKSKS